tara:strand:- start:69 stop:2060 length:1992 start_codon:yes stop_codon:yes gene_type:complete
MERGLTDVWQNYFKFAFVRNPWDRMVSCWKNRGKKFKSFPEFLSAYPYESKNHNLIWHTLPQLTHLSNLDGEIMVDYIGKFENLQEEFDTALNELNLPSITLPKLNSSSHDHYSNYYETSEQIDFIYRIYQQEIDMFGYKYENCDKKKSILVNTTNKKDKKNNLENISKEIVVARYSEQLNWILKVDSDIKIIVYNKGKNDLEPNILSRINELRHLPNVGREGHTYLNHIVENYDKLADITFFTQGVPHLAGQSLNNFLNIDEFKEKRSVMKLQPNDKSVNHIFYHDNNNPPDHCKLAFTKRWVQTQKSKHTLHDYWNGFINYAFPLKEQCNFSYNATFSVTKSYIQNYNLEYYNKIKKSLEHHVAPEEGHFLERAWGTIFNPNKEMVYDNKPTSEREMCVYFGANGEFNIKLPKNPNRYIKERARCVQHLIYDTIQKYDLKTKFKFNLFMGDRPKPNSYSFSTVSGKYEETFPDWSFYGWETAGIKSFRDAIQTFPKSPPETNKIGWIGSLLNVKARKDFVKKFSDTHFSDAYTTQGCFNLKIRKPPKFMTHSEQILKWKYLIDIRGIGYSGRTKFLMHSNRVVFLVNSPFEEYWYQFLEPWKHYVPVKDDYSDLEENYYKVENDKNLHDFILNEQTKFAKKYITYESALSRIRDIVIKNEN